MNTRLEAAAAERLGAIANADAPITAKLDAMLALLASYRSEKLLDDLIGRYGRQVLAGPFKGMELAADGILPLHLIGGYEHMLEPHIEALLARPYDRILNIGCSFGYYAVGFARRLPGIPIDAYDTDPRARDACRQMAVANGVADRITIGETFHGEHFADYAGQHILVLCDIEGAERALLDPQAYPALAAFDILVELHDCYDDTLSTDLPARFAESHAVTMVSHSSIRVDMPDMLWNANSLDQAIVAWEGRAGPTPWAVMLSRRSSGAP